MLGRHTTREKNVECAHREGGKRQAARRKRKTPGWTHRKGKITTGGRAVRGKIPRMGVPRGKKTQDGCAARLENKGWGRHKGGNAGWARGMGKKLQDGSVTSGGEAGWARREGEKR